MKNKIYFSISFLVLVVWMLFIFGMSAKSGEESAGLSFGIAKALYGFPLNEKMIKFESFHTLIRKCAHFTEYGILGILIVNFIHSCGRMWNWKVMIFVSGFCLIYAALDEYHQSFVDGRGPSVGDVCIDTLGAVIFQVLIYILLIRWKMKTLECDIE